MRDPGVYVFDDKGIAKRVQDSQFDSKGEYLRVALPADSVFAVRASLPQGISFSFIAIILFLVGVIAGIVILIVNRRKKQAYDEYLRSKYYEL